MDKHAHILARILVSCSTANTDPMVFGGAGNSPLFARTFAPDQRSVEELEKILSWNGVHHKVMQMRVVQNMEDERVTRVDE